MAFEVDTIRLFYKIDQYALERKNELKLDSLNNYLIKDSDVKIEGYADYLGDKLYNVNLSKKRADIVTNYLKSLRNYSSIKSSGKGQILLKGNDFVADGNQFYRRVDIITTLYSPPKKHSDSTRSKIIIAKLIDSPSKKVITFPGNSISTNLNIKRAGFVDKINNISKLTVGQTLSIEELTFQPGRHFLNMESIPYLIYLLKYLKNHKDIRFEIQGHICCDFTDNDGYDFDTKEYHLSVNRAKFIYDYFVKNGIKTNRMKYKGFGSSEPKIFPEASEVDKYLNRRVEILIIGK